MLTQAEWNSILQHANVQGIPRPAYRLQGKAPIPVNYQQRLAEGIPPATAGYPLVPQPVFKEAEMQRREGEGGFWNSALGFVGGPLKYLGRALSSGEYAVSSMLRSFLRASRDEPHENPISAFFKGFASGFTGDEDFDVTFSEFIEDAGWNPEDTWSAENIAQEAVGLIGGVLLDPLTYALSFGAKGAARFTTEIMEGALKKNGIATAKVAEAVGKAQREGKNFFLNKVATNKRGDKLIRAIADDVFKQAGTGRSGFLAGKAGPGLQSRYASFVKAKKDFLNLMLSKAGGKTPEQLLTLPRYNRAASRALKMLGKDMTPENLNWLIDKGINKFLDQPGIHLFGKTLLPFALRKVGPRTQSLYGLAAATAIKHKIPLAWRIAESPAINAITSDIGRAWNKSGNAFKYLFSLGGKLKENEKKFLMEFSSRIPENKDISSRIIASLLGSKNPAKDLRYGKLAMNVPSNTGKFANKLEQRFIGLLGEYAADKGIGADELFEYATKRKDVFSDIFLAKKDGTVLKHFYDLDDDAIRRISTSARDIRKFLENLRGLEGIVDFGDKTFWDNYLPHVVKGFRKGDTVEAARNTFGRIPFYDKARTNLDTGLTFREWMQKRANKGYVIEDDIQKALMARILPSFNRATFQDILQRGINEGVFTTKKGSISLLEKIDDPKFYRNYPDLAYALAEQSESIKRNLAVWKGSQGELKGPFAEAQKWFRKLYNTEPDKMADYIQTQKIPRNITQPGADELKRMYQERIDELMTKTIEERADTAKGQDIIKRTNIMRENQKAFEFRVDNAALQNETYELALQEGMKEQLRGTGVFALKNPTPTVRQIKIDNILKKSKKAGAEEFIPAIVAKIGDRSKSLALQSDEVLDQLNKILSSKTRQGSEKFNKIVDFLTPVKAVDQTDLIKKLPKVKVKDPITGAVRSADTYGMDHNFLRELVHVYAPQELNTEAINTIAKTTDAVTNPLKRALTVSVVPILPGLKQIPRIAFHTRNLVDLAFRSSRAIGMKNLVGNKRTLKSAAEIMSGKDGILKIHDIIPWEISYKEIRQHLTDAGLYRTSFAGHLGITAGRRKSAEELDSIFANSVDLYRSFMRDVTQQFAEKTPGRIRALSTEKIGQNMENFFLVKSAIDLLERGQPWDEVVNSLHKYLFSYNNLTEFERGFMRRFVMFYPFQRQALPFVAEMLAKQPAAFHVFGDMRQAAYENREEEVLVPDWVRDFPMMRIERKGNRIRMASFRNVFTLDTISDLVPSQMSHVFGQINPILASIPELMLGHDLYFNKPIGEGVDELGVFGARKKLKWQKMSKFMQDFPLVGKFLNVQEVTYPSNGQKALTVNAAAWHLLKGLHFSRLYRELNELTRTMEGDKKFVDWATRFFTGVKIYDIDLEKQMQFLNYDAEKAKRMYDAAVSRGDKAMANTILKKARIPDGG